MPRFPRYESQGQLTTQQPSFLAAEDTSGQIMQKGAETVAKVGDAAIKWSNAVDTIQKTTATANFKTGMADILQRAQNDPDYNNSEQYFKEIEKLRTDNLKGFSSKAAEREAGAEFWYESKVGQLQIDNLYKKKMIDVGQTSTLKLVDLQSKNPSPESAANIKSILSQQVAAGVFDNKAAYEIEKKAIETMNQNAFYQDLQADKDYAKEQLKKNAYGFDAKQSEKAKFILERAEKRDIQAAKEAQLDNTLSAGTELVNGTLTTEKLQEMVINGQMDSEIAGAFEIALFNPKLLDDQEPTVAGRIYKKAIEDMDKFSPDAANKVLNMAVKEFSSKNSKIKASDLAFILKTIDQKRKNPDGPIWGFLKSALGMSTGAIGAFSKFSQNWDFQADPRPVMKQAIIDQAKEDDPALANYEIGTVIKRKSGSYEVVGFNEDGKPVFKKK